LELLALRSPVADQSLARRHWQLLVWPDQSPLFAVAGDLFHRRAIQVAPQRPHLEKLIHRLDQLFVLHTFITQELAYVRVVFLLHVGLVVLAIGTRTSPLDRRLAALKAAPEMPVEEFTAVVGIHPFEDEGYTRFDLFETLAKRVLADYITKPFSTQEILNAIAARVSRLLPLRERIEQLLTDRQVQVSANGSHELMTSLTGVLGGLDLIEMEVDSIKLGELKELLGLVREGVERQFKLSRKLIRYFELEQKKHSSPKTATVGCSAADATTGNKRDWD
ncbi:MAG: hypothetical protein ACKVJX_17210, partial [Verrucomicrobiia bacterium]